MPYFIFEPQIKKGNGKMRKAWILPISLLTLLVLLIGMGAGTCGDEEIAPPSGEEEEAPPAGEEEELVTPTPAEFEVISLDVEPQEIMMGEAVTITAEVENTGGSEGTYSAVLAVDGVTLETKDVAITPGSSEVVVFSLLEDTPGTYEISIGELSLNLLVENAFELKYDDGTADDIYGVGRSPGTGHLTHFTPPVTPFLISEINIYGRLYGSGYEDLEFTVEVWDKRHKIIWSVSYLHTAKFTLNPEWVTIEVPYVLVSGDFYVHVFTCTPYTGGLFIGYDSSIPNEHSEFTSNWRIDRSSKAAKSNSRINWMIRVVGTIEE